MEKGAENYLDNNGIKVILLGNSGVGKTSIINVATGGKFDMNENVTLSASYAMKKIRVNKQDYILNIWDTTGQEKLRELTKIFYSNSKIVIFVYDITSKESFTELDVWLKDIEEKLGTNFVKGVVANKTDLFLDEIVKNEEGEEYATSIGAKFLEFSAKKENPLKFEKFLVDLLLEYFKESTGEILGGRISLTKKSLLEGKQRKNCC